MPDKRIEKLVTIINTLYNLKELAVEANKGDEPSKISYIQTISKLGDIFLEYDDEEKDVYFIQSLEKLLVNLTDNVNNNMFLTPEFNKFTDEIKNSVSCKLPTILFETQTLDNDMFEIIMSFYMENEFNNIATKALGILCAALTQKVSQPDRCYLFALEAFKLYPNIAGSFASDYIYDEKKLSDKLYEQCPICSGEEATPYFCAPQFFATSNNVFSPVKLWLKCEECGNIYAYNFPVIKMGDINGHYTKDQTDEIIEPRYTLRIYSDIFNKCRKITKGNRYLEIGVGRGEMIAAAMEMGYEVDAVEICRDDCEKISSVLNIDIKWSDFMKYDTDKKYDVIIMGDVLEHVSEPIKALKKAKNFLSEDGVLWLSTPNYNSGFSRLVKFQDPMWNQPNHITYFSYETLLPILREIGLNVERYDISNRFNGSMELYCVNFDKQY